MKSSLYLIYFLLILIGLGCKMHSTKANRIIIIQPFENFSILQAKEIYKKLKDVNPNTLLRSPIPFPTTSYYFPRSRYRADSLINFLNHYADANTIIIGITNKDISTTNGNIKDWGIMGLGFRPGNACIVSTFRLAKINLNNQFYKVALHELGHTQGLPHCMIKTCFMRDAEGGNHLDEEEDFCSSCKLFLTKKGWQLN